jgi:hypothetical protein
MSEICERFRALLPEYWSGAISVNQNKEVEQHLAGCEECRSESEYLKRVWTNLELIPAEAPSPALRARFYESLDAYRRGAEESAEPLEKKQSWWTRGGGWWTRPMFQFAAAAAMLAVGVFVGRTVEFRKDTNQLGELHGEVDHMRQLVALSLMQQQSATDRLQGVNWAYRVEKSDTEVVSALLNTVREDASVNVRLAAVDALRPFAKSSPLVRKALIQSLIKQDSPMVEIALVDLLVDLREPSAIAPMKMLSSDAKQPSEVRERARSAAAELQ